MSALVCYLSEDIFAIATDTLVYKVGKENFVPISYNSKVNFLPHFDCCWVSMGFMKLGEDFHAFSNKVLATSFEEFIGIVERLFYKTINIESYETVPGGMEENVIGSLFLFGYNKNLDKLKAYELKIDRDGFELAECPTDNVLIQHPKINKESLARIDSQATSPLELIVKVIKEQHSEFNYSQYNKIALGGDVILTTLSKVDSGVTISIDSIHRFPDYQECFDKMSLR